MTKLSIRNILKLGKKSKDASKASSPTSSVASFSSESTASMPRTPPHGPVQETRGIFRTLEPVWYYHTSFAPDQAPSNDGWIRFDEESQHQLESAHYNDKSSCILPQTSLGPCTVFFVERAQAKNPHAFMHKRRPTTMMVPPSQRVKERFASMPSLNTTRWTEQSEELPPLGIIMDLNKNVRRAVAPVWWYEQDSFDGTKGMCRFDYKNQARLEALSDDRSRLVLTDEAFLQPFTVVLDTTKSRDQREEMRGFIYLDPIAPEDNILTKEINSQYIEDQLCSQNLLRRFSI
ncbi:hypothetical protein DFQ28_009474 [Apophysomyces sp. BC1034]|nr:hypothetical protein DFQ30_005619 [Apophysomyces sp. BC1015]KAG0177669.1 hypothetical protein DFQ29_004541 [Apophysomyces sp. BC1021]KAG0185370.1 hypothetical protein DFQ28_009474 [Apophysomyces sp. BC1034]